MNMFMDSNITATNKMEVKSMRSLENVTILLIDKRDIERNTIILL